MSLSCARGIVLSRKLSGEADYICSVFTREWGREMIIFKGLKKSKKRSPSASETGSVIDFTCYSRQGFEIKTVSQFDLISTPEEVKKKALKIFTLCYMMEIVDKTTGCSDADEGIYNLLCSAVSSLGKAEHEINFALFYAIQYLRIQGILPKLQKCSSCGETGFTACSINSRSLKIVCSGCSSRDDLIISRKSLDFLSLSLKEKYTSIDHSIFSEKEILPLCRIITDFIEHYYSVVIRSKEMLLYPPPCSNSSKPSPASLFV